MTKREIWTRPRCQHQITYSRSMPILNDDGREICGAAKFTPEYGPERCMNALCNWNLQRKKILWDADV